MDKFKIGFNLGQLKGALISNPNIIITTELRESINRLIDEIALELIDKPEPISLVNEGK